MNSKRKRETAFDPSEHEFRKDKVTLRWLSITNVIIYVIIILAILFGLMILI